MYSRICNRKHGAVSAAGIRGLSLACLLLVFSPSCGWCASDDFDGDIQTAVKQWWIDLPFWKLWKSQLIAESNLDPTAKSGVGAEGIAQIMVPTFHDLALALRFPANVTAFDASYAIIAGAYYDANLRRTWKLNRTPIEAHSLALASYNAGTGHILAAQKDCDDAHLWPQIQPCLVNVTGTDNAEQTTGYVIRIQRIWKTLETQ